MVSSCDVIVHVAAKISYDLFDNSIVDVNVKGTNNIVKLATELNCKKIIYVSSLPVIGLPSDLPITEEHVTNPLTLYHISKLAGEHIIRNSERQGIVPFILRITSPVGLGMNQKTIFPTIIKNCWKNEDIVLQGNGSRRQDYINVKDISKAVLLCLQNNKGGIFNIASSKSTSNLDLANLCKKITNSSSEIKFSGLVDSQEDIHWDVSVEKANKEINFYPSMTIEENIKELAIYFEDNML